jgi:hypothetical protein
MNNSSSRNGLMDHLLVPVANVEDPIGTGRAVSEYSTNTGTVLRVVEKGERVPDKTPVEQSETIAEESFAAFREEVSPIEEKIIYWRDVIAGINDIAADVDAPSIGYQPRGGSRIIQYLSGDKSLRLITEAKLPVIAFPKEYQT